jgi:hypothetical protein
VPRLDAQRVQHAADAAALDALGDLACDTPFVGYYSPAERATSRQATRQAGGLPSGRQATSRQAAEPPHTPAVLEQGRQQLGWQASRAPS